MILLIKHMLKYCLSLGKKQTSYQLNKDLGNSRSTLAPEHIYESPYMKRSELKIDNSWFEREMESQHEL
jgi:hypothetical protein